MIPRHRPPFGLLSLLKHRLGTFSGDPARLEAGYCQALEVPYAVWLPSARYGICQTLHSVLKPAADVYAPVFTCRVVHEAVRRSGCRLRLLDSGSQDFLMDLNAAGCLAGDHGVVLSEVFGHRFRQPGQADLTCQARLRIFDMAMAIPTASDLQRLRDQDVAVTSFGLGKALYSGWGGMAFTRDGEVARRLRQARDRDLAEPRWIRSLRHELEVWVRTGAHLPVLYGSLRTLTERSQRSRVEPCSADGSPAGESTDLSREWWHRPSRFTTQLTAANLQQAELFRRQRRDLAMQYRNLLKDLDGDVLRLPPDEPGDLSHFSIRVDQQQRDGLRQQLHRSGVDTATLFRLPPGCSVRVYPRAGQAAQEIINLPLSHQLNPPQVRKICSEIRNCAAPLRRVRAAA